MAYPMSTHSKSERAGAGGNPEGAGCWAKVPLFPPGLVLVSYLPSYISLSTIFVCTAAACLTLKPGSSNSLGQPFHPSLRQFLVQLLLLLPQNRNTFLLAPVMWPLVHTHCFRQPFFYSPLSTHVSHFQNSKGEDNLCWSQLCLFIPSNSSIVSTSTNFGSLPSHAVTWVISHYLLHSHQ